MPKTRLYAPQLDPDVTSMLYHAARRRRIPMTRLASTLVREGLARLESTPGESSVVHEEPPTLGPGERRH